MPLDGRCVTDRLRIIVLGYIVRGPIGGLAWHHLQYVIGLARLGHEVLFIEDSDDYPSCYDPSKHTVDIDPGYGLQFAEQSFDRAGCGQKWAYYDAHRQRWLGPAADQAIRRCHDADLLLNISGVNPIRPWLENIPARVFIDTDPVFTQVRHLTDAQSRERASVHTSYFSFGESFGSADCRVPDDGFDWQATRQPVVLELWPVTFGPEQGAFTTVMQWDSYPAVEHAGQHFGMKSDSFHLVKSLPQRVCVPLEIALGGPANIRQELVDSGWHTISSLDVTRDPWTYQDYLQSSRGEFGVAKQGYVVSRSGWFSERTASYLASGRPAIVQDTGFSQHLPCGTGLLPFDDVASAVEALEIVTCDYQRHCRAARELASEYFDSDRILTSLLERTFATTSTS